MTVPSMGKVEEVELSVKRDSLNDLVVSPGDIHKHCGNSVRNKEIKTQMLLEAVSIRDVLEGKMGSYCHVGDKESIKRSKIKRTSSTPVLLSEAHQGNFHLSASIWGRNKTSIRFKTWLHSHRTILMHQLLSTCYILLSYFEHPTNSRALNDSRFVLIANVVGWILLSYFYMMFCIQFWCIWPQRKLWANLGNTIALFSEAEAPNTKRSTKFIPDEQLWIIAYGFVLTLEAITRLLEYTDAPGFSYTKETRYGTVHSGVAVAMRVTRGLVFFFWCRRERKAFLGFIGVVRKITGIGLLLLVVFVLFYFIIRALLSWYNDAASLEEKNAYFDGNSDGMFNLFVGMTTANHPDIFMAMYNDHWYLMSVLVLFMVCTNLVLVNILLAVICAAYSDMMKTHIKTEMELSKRILSSIFESVVSMDLSLEEARNPESPESSHRRQSSQAREEANFKLERHKGLSYEMFSSLLHVVTDDQKKIAMWFSLMDVSQDGYIDREEFIKFRFIAHSPIVRTPWENEIRKDKRGSEDNIFPFLFKITTSNSSSLFELYMYMCCSTAETKAHDGSAHLLSCRELWYSGFTWMLQSCSYNNFIALINFAVMLEPIMRKDFPNTKSQDCHSSGTGLWIVYIILFGVDAFLSALGEATTHDWLYYISPWVKMRDGHRHWRPVMSHLVHLFDISFIVLLFIAISDVCSNGTDIDYVVVLSLLRGLKCFLVLMEVNKNYCKVATAVFKCLPAIVPQANLFFVVFFAFAVVGQGLFAGCVTENAPEGPGDWTGTQWAGSFADAEYYAELNFDNLWASFVTLFMLMIQNNWQVTVDGYVKCTGTKWARVYFVIFNITTAMIMINILTSVLLDMYSLHTENSEADMEGHYMLLDKRLREFKYPRLEQVNSTKANKPEWFIGKVPEYSEKPLEQDWEINTGLDATLLNIGMTSTDAIKLASDCELTPMEEMVSNLPMPVYIRTKTNRIVFCNKLFAHLYDKEVNDLVGSMNNFLLTSEYWSSGKRHERKPCTFLLAMDSGSASYISPEVLKDGTEVVFNCNEKPINYGIIYGYCTVVFMIPLISETGTIMLDLNFDGTLDTRDKDRADALRMSKSDFGQPKPGSIGPFAAVPVDIRQMNLSTTDLDNVAGSVLNIGLKDLPTVSQVPGVVTDHSLMAHTRLSAASPLMYALGTEPGDRQYFVYPLDAIATSDESCIANLDTSDPRISLLTVGGFLRTDKNGKVIAASALTEGNSLVLKGPFPFPWTKMKQKLIACGYIHSCTLPALIKLGVTGFCWLGSRQSTGMEEYLEGNEPAPDGSKWKYGAFLYLYENHPEYDCFFPVAAISKWEETMLHLHCYAASTGKGKGFDLSNLAKERSDFKNRSLGTAEKAQNLLDSATISSCEDITELQFNGMCMATFVGGIFKLLHMTLRPTHDISLTVRPNQFSKRFREIYRFPFSSLHNYETTLHEMLPAVYHDGLARMLGNRKGLKNIFNEIEELDSTLSQIQAKLVELVPAYQYSDIIIVVPRNVENEEDLAALFPGSVPKCFRSEDKIRSSGRSIRLGETPEDMNSGAESEEPVDVDKPANDATDKTVRL